MFAVPPASRICAADRPAVQQRRAFCAWGIALAVTWVLQSAARAERPYPIRSTVEAAETSPQSLANPFASPDFSTTHGNVIDAAGDDRSIGRMVPVSAENVEEAAIPIDGARSAGFAAGVADDPLSRLKLPESASQFDPAQTLKDWAEGAGLLIAFVIVSLWLVRQWVARQAGASGPTAHLRTIESLSLPQRCRIHLVDVDGRQVLVAVDASGIKSVTPLPDRFASLLENAEGPSPMTGERHSEPDASRHNSWDGRPETRLT